MKRFLMALGMCLACACSSAALAADANVRAWLDRDSMQLGETVTLNVEAQDGNSAQPDFSALKQDFNLLGTQSSQQISIVNGRSASKTLWAVGLEPKHEGRLAIPAIVVGKAATSPIALTVLAQASPAQAKANGDVFLEVSAEPTTPYVQQQVRYTAKLYYAFDLTDGNLNEPQADGIGVQRLGQDKSYVATVGARRYHVIERHYALTPERSGPLDIPALAFRGNALDVTDPTGFFSRGRGVSARSEPVHLEVKPKPAQWTDGTWLPAASLLLKDEGEMPTQVHVGDPITRTVRIQAQGLGFEQLPELDLKAPEGGELYPDKSETRTRDDGEWLYGERVRKFAFVPNRAGTFVVPSVKLRWWDTEHDRAVVAELPEHTIDVLPAAGATAPSAAARAAQPSTAAATSSDAGTAILTQPSGSASAPASSSLRRWQALAALGFALWLITLALWWRGRHTSLPIDVATTDSTSDGGAGRSEFLRACALGEFAGAERALIAWARSERPEIANVGQLAQRLADPHQREALADLQRMRYAGVPSDGLGTRLQKAFKGGIAWTAAASRRTSEATLPALYPSRE